MRKQGGGRSRWMSSKWWKATIVLMGLAGVDYLAMWFFKKEYLMQEQGGFVISVCYLVFLALLLLFIFHLFYPGSCRRILVMVVTAIVNRNREAIPPKEITDQLGGESEVIDKKIVKVANAEIRGRSCTDGQARETDMSLKVLRKIAPQASSFEAFFDEVTRTGAKPYYPIIRRLIKEEDSNLSNVYRIMYELVSDTDKVSFDVDEPAYRKENLKWLISCNEIGDKWRYYCNYISVCYRNEEYDSVIECAQEVIDGIDDTDAKCSARRTFVYIFLGAIYLERAQYNYAIPYFEEVLRISTIRVPALFRLAYIYFLRCDYHNCLYYARLCFSELPDFKTVEVGNDMEYNLIKWIAYCAAACGEYAEGCTTLENYLASASARVDKDEQTYIESYLTYLLGKVGKWDDAYALSKKVLSRDPMNNTAVNVKGMSEMRLGHYDIAVNCFTSIIPGFKEEKTQQAKYYLGEIYNNLAICEAKLGRKKEADEHFRAAFDCNYPAVDVLQFSKVAIGPLGLQIQESNSETSLKPLQSSN